VNTLNETYVDPQGVEWQHVTTFFVAGVPKPGGSKRGFFIQKIKRVIIVDDCKKSRAWKDTVAAFAADSWGNRPLLEGVLSVDVEFTMPRPKGHFRTGRHAGELRADAPAFHTSKPDTTKLWRSTEDALTGIVWHDDSCIADQCIRKVYGDKPGAKISVYQLALHADQFPARDVRAASTAEATDGLATTSLRATCAPGTRHEGGLFK